VAFNSISLAFKPTQNVEAAFFAYTLVKLFGMDAFKMWPYIVGLVIGLVYGACWHLRDSD